MTSLISYQAPHSLLSSAQSKVAFGASKDNHQNPAEKSKINQKLKAWGDNLSKSKVKRHIDTWQKLYDSAAVVVGWFAIVLTGTTLLNANANRNTQKGLDQIPVENCKDRIEFLIDRLPNEGASYRESQIEFIQEKLKAESDRCIPDEPS